jgi:hypothetical protein
MNTASYVQCMESQKCCIHGNQYLVLGSGATRLLLTCKWSYLCWKFCKTHAFSESLPHKFSTTGSPFSFWAYDDHNTHFPHPTVFRGHLIWLCRVQHHEKMLAILKPWFICLKNFLFKAVHSNTPLKKMKKELCRQWKPLPTLFKERKQLKNRVQ